MKRRESRETAFRLLFALEFNADDNAENVIETAVNELSGIEEFENPDFTVDDYALALLNGTVEHKAELDEMISKCLVNWRIERIPITAKEIMRLALYEIKYQQVKPAIVISEAIEIIKRYEDNSVVSFINGALGNAVKLIGKEEEK
ncbi:MAG: transcription antitermination factor NusB [Bacillota bacterium]|nr:transcription antitermination factor NusB [Bacillota bacterium]